MVVIPLTLQFICVYDEYTNCTVEVNYSRTVFLQNVLTAPSNTVYYERSRSINLYNTVIYVNCYPIAFERLILVLVF